MPVERAKVISKFRELGGTADEVAAKLEEMEITGEPGNPKNCPLFHWAWQTFAGELLAGEYVSIEAQQIVVDGVECKKTSLPEYLTNEHVREETVPPWIWDFVERFDKGDYEDLIGEGYEAVGDEDEEEEEDLDDDLDEDEYDDEDDFWHEFEEEEEEEEEDPHHEHGGEG